MEMYFHTHRQTRERNLAVPGTRLVLSYLLVLPRAAPHNLLDDGVLLREVFALGRDTVGAHRASERGGIFKLIRRYDSSTK